MMYMFLFSMFSLFSICYTYDQSVAEIAIRLAQASYCLHSNSQWNCATCDQSNKLEYIIDQHNEVVLQGYNSNTRTLFVSFRGSANIPNWIDNIQINKISPYSDKNVQIEAGFYKAYNYVKSDIMNNLQKLTLKYSTNNLFITGHSLGAAMATILAYDILTLSHNYSITHLITFGSPRVGNQAFVENFRLYSVDSYRITHYYDIVPHVPEEMFGYLHISNEIWYDEPNVYYTVCNDNDNVEDSTCSNSCAPIHCTSTSDHLLYMNISMGTSGTC